MKLRTEDTTYGEDYWGTLDNGAGYVDSVMWEDLSVIVKEIFFHLPTEDLTLRLNLLDMGCAYGFLVRHLRRRGVGAWGADSSQYPLDHAPSDTRPYLHKYDLTSTQSTTTFKGFPFDLVTCFETMEHIEEQYVRRALLHIQESLRPGGRVLFTICTDSQPGWDTDPTHVTIKPRSWWTEELVTAGFRHDEEATERVKGFHLFRHHDGVFIMDRP